MTGAAKVAVKTLSKALLVRNVNRTTQYRLRREWIVEHRQGPLQNL